MSSCNFEDPYSINALNCYTKQLKSVSNPKHQKFGYKLTSLGDNMNFIQPTNLKENKYNAYGEYKRTDNNQIGYYKQVNPIGYGAGYHKNSYCATNFCYNKPKCTNKNSINSQCELPSKWDCGPNTNCRANFKLSSKSPFGKPQRLTTANNFSSPQYNYEFPIPIGFHTTIPDTLFPDSFNVNPNIKKKNVKVKMLPETKKIKKETYRF